VSYEEPTAGDNLSDAYDYGVLRGDGRRAA
jgi:hypothetical protein